MRAFTHVARVRFVWGGIGADSLHLVHEQIHEGDSAILHTG